MPVANEDEFGLRIMPQQARHRFQEQIRSLLDTQSPAEKHGRIKWPDAIAALYGRRVNQSIDVSSLRWTAGAELRLLLPVFGAPLRFIYAVNLDEQTGDEFDSFRFSIGAAF